MCDRWHVARAPTTYHLHSHRPTVYHLHAQPTMYQDYSVHVPPTCPQAYSVPTCNSVVEKFRLSVCTTGDYVYVQRFTVTVQKYRYLHTILQINMFLCFFLMDRLIYNHQNLLNVLYACMLSTYNIKFPFRLRITDTAQNKR